MQDFLLNLRVAGILKENQTGLDLFHAQTHMAKLLTAAGLLRAVAEARQVAVHPPPWLLDAAAAVAPTFSTDCLLFTGPGSIIVSVTR